MEKVKFKSLLALLLILTTATPSFAIWKVVTDPHCLKVVTTNLATQKAIEGQHNHRLDSIAIVSEKSWRISFNTFFCAPVRGYGKFSTNLFTGSSIGII